MPWDMQQLANTPQWQVLQRPKADGVRAIAFTGLPFRGTPTRVFAWLGIPEVKPGEKVPAMVLVHGGGGTAFDEWVRLWVARGYAAIAMDTCGQVPVGNYGQYVRDDTRVALPVGAAWIKSNRRGKINGLTMRWRMSSWRTR